MKMSNKARYAIVMLLGVGMNLLFNQIAFVLNLPFWLDMGGTMMAAIVLEPAAGILVGLFCNFYESVFFYDISSILYFAVSAAAALAAGILIKKNGRIHPKRILPTMLLTVAVTSVVSTLLTLWRTQGLPDSAWEQFYYQTALGWGWPVPFACFLGVFLLKLYDILASAVLIAAVYALLPKCLKYSPAERLGVPDSSGGPR